MRFFGFFFLSSPKVSPHHPVIDLNIDVNASSGSGSGGGLFHGSSLTRVVESGVRGVAKGVPPRNALASALLRAVVSGVRGIGRAEDIGRDDDCGEFALVPCGVRAGGDGVLNGDIGVLSGDARG